MTSSSSVVPSIYKPTPPTTMPTSPLITLSTDRPPMSGSSSSSTSRTNFKSILPIYRDKFGRFAYFAGKKSWPFHTKSSSSGSGNSPAIDNNAGVPDEETVPLSCNDIVRVIPSQRSKENHEQNVANWPEQHAPFLKGIYSTIQSTPAFASDHFGPDRPCSEIRYPNTCSIVIKLDSFECI